MNQLVVHQTGEIVCKEWPFEELPPFLKNGRVIREAGTIWPTYDLIELEGKPTRKQRSKR